MRFNWHLQFWNKGSFYRRWAKSSNWHLWLCTANKVWSDIFLIAHHTKWFYTRAHRQVTHILNVCISILLHLHMHSIWLQQRFFFGRIISIDFHVIQLYLFHFNTSGRPSIMGAIGRSVANNLCTKI